MNEGCRGGGELRAEESRPTSALLDNGESMLSSLSLVYRLHVRSSLFIPHFVWYPRPTCGFLTPTSLSIGDPRARTQKRQLRWCSRCARVNYDVVLSPIRKDAVNCLYFRPRACQAACGFPCSFNHASVRQSGVQSIDGRINSALDWRPEVNNCKSYRRN